MKEKETIKNGGKYYNVEQHDNYVGDNSNANFGIFLGEDVRINSDEIINYSAVIIEELEEVETVIKNSNELSEDQKKTLYEIIKDAKEGTSENNKTKISRAKRAFNSIKSFLITVSPTLIATLANLTKIASFFQINK